MKNLTLFFMFVLIVFSFGFIGCSSGENPVDETGKPTIIKLIPSEDSFVYSVDPDETYNDGAPSCPGCGAALRLSPSGGHVGESRLLLKYPLEQIPSGSEILSASLRFKDLSGATNNSNDCVNFTIREILNVWSEYTVTWNNQPRHRSISRASGSICGETFDQEVDLNIQFLQDIVDGSIKHRGFIVLPVGTVTGRHYKAMFSKEGNGEGIVLIIKYKK